MKEEYIDILSKEKKSSNPAKNWNNRAKEFYRYTKESKNNEVLDFLNSKMEFTGKKILDIGCGAGRFLLPFVKAGAHVTGIDIAEDMIYYTEKILTESNIPKDSYELLKADWKDIHLDARGWKSKFDLVFASMSPGVSDWESIKKLVAASKGHVYISSFAYRHESALLELQNQMESYRENDWGERFRAMINLLLLNGYLPDVKFTRKVGSMEFVVEDLINRYKHRFINSDPTGEKTEELRKLIDKIGSESNYTMYTDRVIGMLLFSVNDKIDKNTK